MSRAGRDPRASKIYELIRLKNPANFGVHWHGVGSYCGNDDWCDPDVFGCEGYGELEFAPDEEIDWHLKRLQEKG